MKYSSPAIFRSLTLTGTVCFLGGCQHVNMAQITYEVLRANDCQRNQLEDFCSRTYASEYHAYEQLRQEFLRTKRENKRLESRNTLILSEQSLDMR